MSSFDVEGRLTRYKEEVNAEITTSRQRRRKMEALTEEAQSAHKTGRYEVSFDKVRTHATLPLAFLLLLWM